MAVGRTPVQNVRTMLLSSHFDKHIVIKPEPAIAILKEAVRSSPNESGGPLFGLFVLQERSMQFQTLTVRRQMNEKLIISVTSASAGMGSSAASGETMLELDAGVLAVQMRDAWAGGAGFIGFWHTHPGGVYAPSRKDDRAARKFFKGNPHVSHYVQMIVAMDGGMNNWKNWHAHVYLYLRRDRAGRRLPLRSKGQEIKLLN